MFEKNYIKLQLDLLRRLFCNHMCYKGENRSEYLIHLVEAKESVSAFIHIAEIAESLDEKSREIYTPQLKLLYQEVNKNIEALRDFIIMNFKDFTEALEEAKIPIPFSWRLQLSEMSTQNQAT